MTSKNIASLFKCIMIMALFFSAVLQAEMLISPMRVVFEDRDRSEEVILINPSNQTRSYRLEFVEKKALPLGGYQDLDAQQSAKFPIASNMLRFSPRQVTLAAGDRQIVKLAVRRPKGLADGEYRSHLKFTALPLENENDASPSDALGIKLTMLLGYTIPVIVRKGTANSSVSVNDIRILESGLGNEKKYEVEVTLNHSGTFSSHGNLHAYWTPNGTTKETLLGELNSFNFYPELNQVTAKLFWQQPGIPPRAGKLRLSYEGLGEYLGKTLAEKTISL